MSTGKSRKRLLVSPRRRFLVNDPPTEPTLLDSSDLERSRARESTSRNVRGWSLSAGEVLLGGRLRVVRFLGEGGVGAVFEAFDNERRESVALKRLSRIDPTAIYELKSEFRVLGDVVHPNLVRLHELFSQEGAWFFTMDLVRGERFDRWVRPDDQLDLPRLTAATRQLVEGMRAIHAAGKVHRDLKPSNVLVTDRGRVVILDYGLVRDAEGAFGALEDDRLSGTPAFMAPEQAAGRPATPASDMYALGVILFKSLTGRLPLGGRSGELLADRRHERVPAPRTLVPGLPPELDALCEQLLLPDPESRPDVSAILACLNRTQRVAAVVEAPARPIDPVLPLFGREAELAQLHAAFEASVAGKPVIAIVSGESGIGKTALCDHFLNELRARGDTVVLAGRCFERENVPFKAFDVLVDELSRYLHRLPPVQAAALLPRDVFALAQLFPVLERVEVIADAPVRPVSDPQALQRLGFAAYRELLARIGDRVPLVMHTDDLQWTDNDSVVFLRQLLFTRATRSLRGLFMASHRIEGAEDNARLAGVLEAARSNRALDLREIRLRPLDQAATLELARRSLGELRSESSASVQTIAAEAAGSPYFISELARFCRQAGDAQLGVLSLSAMLSARVDALSASARRLLHVLALAGQQLRVPVALQAALATHADLDLLRAAHLVRSAAGPGDRPIECYHDRIRESVCSALSDAEKLAGFQALCAALLAFGEQDYELLSYCGEGAGALQQAAQHAWLAADQAAASLAFDHACSLYRRALELGSFDAEDNYALRTRLARALENAGRGQEAAAAYLDAAALATGDERIELQRCAADQLLTSGHVDEGRALLKQVCEAAGVTFTASAVRSALAFAWTQVRVPTRALRRIGAPVPVTSARQALQLRVGRTGVTGLLSFLPVHAASVAGGYLTLALSHGQLEDQVHALGFNAYLHFVLSPESKRGAVMIDAMQAQANASQSARLQAFANFIRGTALYHRGSYREARLNLGRALEVIRASTGSAWELDAAHVYDQLSAAYGGEHGDIARTSAAWVEEAFRCGRLWAAAMLSGWSGLPAWSGADDIEGYQRQRLDAQRRWRSNGEPKWPDYMLRVGDAYAYVYSGRPWYAFELLDSVRESYTRAGMSRGANLAAMFAVHRGRCAVSALRGAELELGSEQYARLVRAVEESCVALRRFPGVRSLGIELGFAAGLALYRSDAEASAEILTNAVAALDAGSHAMVAAAARRRLGQLLGGDRGREYLAAGEAYMLQQGIANLDATTELWCPGLRS